ncbi:MAG TPA: NAD(P)/FAD-dependent oxidoreductase [Rhodocyclaceae bacterium]|nr:NAD(P)/FAD-dependent oxidoreductase [Rhodocyclaceae bacterium]
METRRSVLVVGSGPAGLSAALWLKNLGLEPVVIETADRAGGLQNLNFLANEWVLGQRGLTGPELAARFVAHGAAEGIRLLTNCGLQGVAKERDLFRARLRQADGGDSVMVCAALLLATGTRYRATEVLADVAGIEGISPGRVLYGPWAFALPERTAGGRVLIVGGGDNAFENARRLLDRDAEVIMALRSPPRAQKALLDAVLGRERCRPLQPAVLSALAEAADGLAASVDTPKGRQTVVVDRVHVLAGYEANSRVIAAALAPELSAAIALDAKGYVVTDPACRTGADGIYAAGDLCNPLFPSVVSAIAQGALAAKTIEFDLRQA